MALPQTNDILFAFKALSIVAGLSANARRVGGALVDHFNRRTGQCDPSIDRLVEKLGIDRATVFRATAELCGDDGFFVRVSHGGRGNRASYSPQWDRFRSVVNEWDGKKSTMPESVTRRDDASENRLNRLNKTPEKVAELRPRTSQNCDPNGRKTATQTNINNQSNKLLCTDGTCGNADDPSADTAAKTNVPLSQTRATKGLLKRSGPGSLSLISVSHAQAARVSAERRIDVDLRNLGFAVHAAAIDLLDEVTTAAAIDAEITRRGAGLALIIERLHLRGSRGPPREGG